MSEPKKYATLVPAIKNGPNGISFFNPFRFKIINMPPMTAPST